MNTPIIKVLVISIENQKDRRLHISQILNDLGIDWEFVDAVIGKNLESFPPQYDHTKSSACI